MLRTLLTVSAIALSLAACAATPKRSVSGGAARPAANARSTAVAASAQSVHRRSPYVGAISVDAATGNVLFEDNADAEAYPASVTKLMTLLLVMEDVRAGKYGYDDKVVATADAYRSEPSWVGIKVGETMSVRDLCTALMVESANDAAIVLGVHAEGSFDGFIARMNARAAELGMKGTRYYNPNGLPPVSSSGKRYPWKSFNATTARDQMRLACELVKIPEVVKLTSVKTCDLIKTTGGYRVSVTRRVNEPDRETTLAEGEKLVKAMRNHNNVMRMDTLTVSDANGQVAKLPRIVNSDGSEAVDGLKTGYIDAGGSSIILTGRRKGKRAIVVVLGSASSKERDGQAYRLMSDALGSLVW